MRHFPMTRVPNLAGPQCGERYDRYRCRVTFSSSQHVRREHVPDYVSVERAVLVLSDGAGLYQVDFPRGTRTVRVEDQSVELPVDDLIAVGRHTYAVTSLHGGEFRAALELDLVRPTVDTSRGAYRMGVALQRYAQKLQLEDYRNLQRVGRFGCWVATLPDDPAVARAAEAVSLDGSWRVKVLPQTSLEDPSRPWYDDTAWDEIAVPSRAEEVLDDDGGVLWYRTSVDVPTGWNESVHLRFDGVDDEAYIYVNGQEAGFHCGWHSGFHVDVSDYLEPERSNVIAVRCVVRRPSGLSYDGGMTYTFIRDYAVNRYPEKSEQLGGVFGHVELARLEHRGPVRFLPRFHPQLEGALALSFEVMSGDEVRPVTQAADSVLHYEPPVIRYERLRAGSIELTVQTLASLEDPIVFFVATLDEGLSMSLAELRLSARCRAETGAEWSLPFASIHSEEAGALFVLAVGPHGEPVRLTSPGKRFDAERSMWERRVYERAMPVRTTPAETAYLRTVRQILTLMAKTEPGEISGLYTDLVKYPVFWLRDTAISIPGTLYGGDLAHEGAVAAAGEIYARARDNATYTILYPDGAMKPMQTATDGPALAVYSIYRVWCFKGTSWLESYYQTVVSYLDHLDSVERAFGNEPDGIIRASHGDWWDYRYHPRYEREGASLFVNVLYLRALKYAVRMAHAMDDREREVRWQERFASGVRTLNRPVEDGGLLLRDRGYFADTVMTLTDRHPNGWKYPDDLDRVTVMAGFRPIPHAIALTEGLVLDGEIARRIVQTTDEFNVVRPYPGLVQYPWYDYMGNEGLGGAYEAGRFRSAWKALPGNHNAGGRWAFAGGLVEKALWMHGARELADEALENAVGVTTLARQPARIIEDAHYSGLFRNESGSAKDAEGFYYSWGVATPLEAIVEGKYGIVPVPGGVELHLERIPVGDGIRNVAVPGGFLSVERRDERRAVVAAEGGSVTVLAVTGSDRSLRVVSADGRDVEAEPFKQGGATAVRLTLRTDGGAHAMTW